MGTNTTNIWNAWQEAQSQGASLMDFVRTTPEFKAAQAIQDEEDRLAREATALREAKAKREAEERALALKSNEGAVERLFSSLEADRQRQLEATIAKNRAIHHRSAAKQDGELVVLALLVISGLVGVLAPPIGIGLGLFALLLGATIGI